MLSTLVNKLVLQSIAIGVTALLIPGLKITAIWGATLMGIALVLVNSTLWDARLFLNLPGSFSTDALSLLLINGLLFWLLVKFLPGIEIKGILPALLAPIVFTISSSVINLYMSDIDWIQKSKEAARVIRSIRDTFLETEDSALPAPTTIDSTTTPNPPSS